MIDAVIAYNWECKKEMKKELIFSVSIPKKDFDVQTFKSEKDWRHQNTIDSGVKITHIISGAVGESSNYRSQHQNKKAALRGLVFSPVFELWLNRGFYKTIGCETIEEEVEKQMNPKIEVKPEEDK